MELKQTGETNMATPTEISKDYRLNDIIFEPQKVVPVIEISTDEVVFGRVIQNFLFSAPYRVGEKALLARPDRFGGRVLFDTGFAEGTETMTGARAEYYTAQYLRFNGILKYFGGEKDKDLNARVDILEVTPAIYDTPQPALDGGLPLNAFEVRGRLITKYS